MARMGLRQVTLAVFLVTVSCLDKNLDGRWEKFKMANNRIYNKDIEGYRREIWETKIKKIEQHNLEAEDGRHSYTMQETKWDDLTYEEFMHFGDGFDVNDIHRVKRANRNGTGDCFNESSWNDSFPYTFTSASSLPSNVDWTEKGYVTNVKDQRRCGSCWAFSAVGTIEGQWYKKTKQLVSLSPQFLVDCSQRNGGCGGGLPSRAFLDVIQKKGISSEKSYPYTGVQGTCRTPGIAASIKGFRTINSRNELLNAVAYVGPISVGIRTGDNIANVGQGVFTDCEGPINHAVLVVGYGVYNGMKVWKIKNSWGETWANKGYFYMARGGSDDCGIYEYASYPTMEGVQRGPVTAGEVSAGNGQQISLLVTIVAIFLALLHINTIN